MVKFCTADSQDSRMRHFLALPKKTCPAPMHCPRTTRIPGSPLPGTVLTDCVFSLLRGRNEADIPTRLMKMIVDVTGCENYGIKGLSDVVSTNHSGSFSMFGNQEGNIG